MDLQGNTALITGASSGLGRDLAVMLAEKGANLVLVSRNISVLKELALNLERDYYIRACVIGYDLSTDCAAQFVFDECLKRGLIIDILINNAGFALTTDEYFKYPDKARAMLNLMVITPSEMCILFSKPMKERGYGYIMNVSSISAYFPVSPLISYGAIKTFLQKYTAELRYALKRSGIKVSCLMPGATMTGFFSMDKYPVPVWVQRIFFCPSYKVAKKGINGMLRGKREIVPGFAAKLALWIFNLLPDGAVNGFFSFIEKIRVGIMQKETETTVNSQTEETGEET